MYRMVLPLDVGRNAEDFTLRGCKGGEVRLGDFLGRGIVFFTFYRGSFDKESVKYLKALKENYPKIREAGADLLAITPELPQKAAHLMEELGLPFEVACDPDMKVAKMYGVYDSSLNWCWPAGFVVDPDGIIQYAFRGASPPNTPPVDYVAAKIVSLKKSREQPQPAAKAM